MTLPMTGAISLWDIRAEFNPTGNNSNVKLEDYYAGGAFVPAGTKNGNNQNIPSSGQISIFDFRGSKRNPLAPGGGLSSHTSRMGFLGTVTAMVGWKGDGRTFYYTGIGDNSFSYGAEWYPGAQAAGGIPGIGANYWARCVVETGVLNGANPGTAWARIGGSGGTNDYDISVVAQIPNQNVEDDEFATGHVDLSDSGTSGNVLCTWTWGVQASSIGNNA